MGNTNHKALIYDPYWDSLGGGEKYTATAAKALLDQNWQVDIYWPKNISAQILDRFGIDLSRANSVYELITNNYELVFWVPDGSLPVSWAKKTLIHFQYPFHDVGGHNIKNLVKSRFYTFISNSQFTKQVVDHEYWINSHVIYPPIKTNDFTPGPKFKHILYVGRFSNLAQAKGHATLIQSFRNIYSRIPDWKLILAGNTNVGTTDEYFDNLQNTAKGLPVEFVINPDLADLKKIYSRASIFWSASGYGIVESDQPERMEHFGMTVVEAMSAGAVPIIVNSGGHPEIVTHGEDGFLWESPDQMEKITLNLVPDKKRLIYVSKFAQNKAKIFSEEKFKVKLSELL
ncbi:MAG: glycosyltransferase family 4 protein [Patescibacteria group bacterium]